MYCIYSQPAQEMLAQEICLLSHAPLNVVTGDKQMQQNNGFTIFLFYDKYHILFSCSKYKRTLWDLKTTEK